MTDGSLETAFKLLNELGKSPPPPGFLSDPAEVVRIVEKEIQTKAVPKFVQLDPMPIAELETRMRQAFRDLAADKTLLPDVPDEDDRMSLYLQLWAGCVWSGKVIALQTRGGRVTQPHERKDFFDNAIDPNLGLPIFAAGVACAYDWKNAFDPPQPVTFAGLDDNHLVRRRYNAKHGVKS